MTWMESRWVEVAAAILATGAGVCVGLAVGIRMGERVKAVGSRLAKALARRARGGRCSQALAIEETEAWYRLVPKDRPMAAIPTLLENDVADDRTEGVQV